jgi:hypothetical protein
VEEFDWLGGVAGATGTAVTGGIADGAAAAVEVEVKLKGAAAGTPEAAGTIARVSAPVFR